MNINLRITFSDGTSKVVTAGAADIVAFEQHFDLSIARLEQNVKLTHLFYLAWHSENRTKATTDSFEQWLENVAGIEADEVKK